MNKTYLPRKLKIYKTELKSFAIVFKQNLVQNLSHKTVINGERFVN